MNGLLFLTGARPGELGTLRWRDFDSAAKPLARLVIAHAIKSGTQKMGGTKTGVIRRVPVHPALGEILEAWWESGWRKHYGRAPTLDDLIVPTREFTPRRVDEMNKQLRLDCRAVNITERKLQCTRRTFISITQDDGAVGSVMKWITHPPPKSVFDQYTTLAWPTLCAEVAKLQIRSAATARTGDESLRESLRTPPGTEAGFSEVAETRLVSATETLRPQGDSIRMTAAQSPWKSWPAWQPEQVALP